MNHYPEALPPSPYPNRLPFMQDFAVSVERPDEAEQQQAAAYFNTMANKLFTEQGSRSYLYPVASPTNWQVAVQTVGSTTRATVPEQGIELSALDERDDEQDAYQYRLGSDGVVRRFDLPYEIDTQQFESDYDFLQRVIEVDEANAANEDFAIEMGMDGQPVFLDELKALNAFIEENRETK